jgi:hypothetical protein
MTTPNETILDNSIRQMVWLERFKTGTVNQIIGLINKSDKDLRNQLTLRLTAINTRGYDLGKETTKRIEAMIAELEAIRTEVYTLAADETKTALSDFAVHEADFQAKMIEQATAGTQNAASNVTLTRPSLTQLRSAALARPFQGRLLKEWSKACRPMMHVACVMLSRSALQKARPQTRSCAGSSEVVPVSTVTGYWKSVAGMPRP